MHRHETSSTKKVKSPLGNCITSFEVEKQALRINPFDNSKKMSNTKWFSVRHLTAFTNQHTRKLAGIWISLLILSTLLLYLFVKDKDTDDRVVITPNGHKIIYSKLKQQKKCPEKSSAVLKNEKKVFQSVRKEHIELIEKFNQANANLETITKAIPLKDAELKELELKIEELRLLQRELNDRRNVKLSLPSSPLHRPAMEQVMTGDRNQALTRRESFRSLEESIDYSRCSISSLFQVYVYNTSLSGSFAKSLLQELNNNPSSSEQASKACLFVAVLENDQKIHKQLKYWGNFGRNHVLLLANDTTNLNFQAAMVVAENFVRSSFRPSMDIAVHLRVPAYNVLEYEGLPQLLPHSREHLLSFASSNVSQARRKDLDLLKNSMLNSEDSFLLDLNCSKTAQFAAQNEFINLCYDHKQRSSFIRRSFFSLIFPDSLCYQQRFYESLLAGSVPVIVSLDNNFQSPLPFQDLIDWRLAVIRIPPARLASELHFILRSVGVADLLEMRRKGRFFLENYLLNTKVLSQSILSNLRFRLQMPNNGQVAVTGQEFVSKNYSLNPLVGVTKPPYDDEYLGPVEAPFASIAFAHNMTAFGMYAYKQWNELPFHVSNTPLFLAQNNPLPSEAEFSEETSLGMRPIAPGSGQEFLLALGGNRPREQFTIVLITYNRDPVLAASLERLHKLPYLNKVLVVWNNIDRAPTGIWPRLHVPLIFINASKNSLNNRFLPFEQIETEAVLSLDDDIDLRQHEIVFAFRTWREHRQRIVGFPARYHARYGQSMHYNSNHTCQFSMILTGAAFLHKSYFYAYTYSMPSIIRQKVDEWMNCEDLAMNFLVSHLTRLPPIKTTSKWTLRCPSCTEMLSQDTGHFNERHECIRFFTQVYGYNPLMFTQFRADSVLFKTRLPANHQKCFRYV